ADVWPVDAIALHFSGTIESVSALATSDLERTRPVVVDHSSHCHKGHYQYDGRCRRCGRQDAMDLFRSDESITCPWCGGPVESGRGTAWGDLYANRWPG